MFLKDIFFPKFCLGCGYLGAYICLNCQKKLSYLKSQPCLYCRKTSLYGLIHPSCQSPQCLDGVMSLFQYNNFLKIIIKNIKYRLADELLKDFFKVIEPKRLIILSFFKRQEKNQGSLLIQPIPLHVNRLRVRGFNQAKIIADAFQKLIDVPLVELLVRKKETFSQAQLKKGEERFNNIRGAFIVTHKAKVKRKSFILIDDVMTSGATIREAAKTLKLNGANRVFALTLAKG